jgi:hypothetical protein
MEHLLNNYCIRDTVLDDELNFLERIPIKHVLYVIVWGKFGGRFGQW